MPTFVILAFVASVCLAQEQPRFAVASIRQSADNEPGMQVRFTPNVGYSGKKLPIVALLTSAFKVSPHRIIGVPAGPERYDTKAGVKPGDATRPSPPLKLLLQSLL